MVIPAHDAGSFVNGFAVFIDDFVDQIWAVYDAVIRKCGVGGGDF